MVVEAFQSFFNDLKSQLHLAGISLLDVTIPPLLSWDTATSMASIIAMPDYYSNDVNNYWVENPQAIQIYFNSPLFALFSSFSAINYGVSDIRRGKIIEFQSGISHE
jgi:hypothetical protein